MGFRFRKTKSFGPFRLTLSRRGLGAGLRLGPFGLSRGADRRWRRTITLPGTGLSHQEVIGEEES